MPRIKQKNLIDNLPEILTALYIAVLFFKIVVLFDVEINLKFSLILLVYTFFTSWIFHNSLNGIIKKRLVHMYGLQTGDEARYIGILGVLIILILLIFWGNNF